MHDKHVAQAQLLTAIPTVEDTQVAFLLLLFCGAPTYAADHDAAVGHGTPHQCWGTPPTTCAHARSCPSPTAGWDSAPPSAPDISRTGRRGPTPSQPSTAAPLASPAGSCTSCKAKPAPVPPASWKRTKPRTSPATPDSPCRPGTPSPHPAHPTPTPGKQENTNEGGNASQAQQPTAMRPPRFFLTLTPRRAHFCCPKPGPTRAEPSPYALQALRSPSPVNTSAFSCGAVCASPSLSQTRLAGAGPPG